MNLMAKAMQAKVGNPIKKLVLLKLADNANDAGECWPSYQHIADQCEISKRSAMRYIDQLENDGFLKVKHRKAGVNQNLTNVYHLTLDISKNSSDTQSSGSDTQSLGGSDTQSPRTSHSLEPVNEPIKKTKAKKVSNPDAKKPQPKTTAPPEKQSAKKPVQPLPIPQELADEIVAYRKLIKKPVTDRALRGIANDMLEAHRQTGLSLEQLAELMQVKGWMTVKADWVSRILDQSLIQQSGFQPHQGQQNLQRQPMQEGQSLTDIIHGWY